MGHPPGAKIPVMTDAVIVLIRHGETEWSRTRRHTGRSDVPLTASGRERATALRGRLPIDRFDLVLSSPLVRAAETAALAGLDAEPADDLMEWDYGEVEGRTTEELRDERGDPEWSVWRDGVTGGETLEAVGERVDRVIGRALAVGGPVALVAHGHLLRILGARWMELAPVEGRRLALDAASWSMLGHERETRVLLHWNVRVS
jgi:probable phosphoglycerate mutase